MYAIVYKDYVSTAYPTIAGTSTITYSLFSVDPVNHDIWIPVVGHQAVIVTPSSVLYDSIQSPGNYNLKVMLDISSHAAFAEVGRYVLQYTFTPTVGAAFYCDFAITVI